MEKGTSGDTPTVSFDKAAFSDEKYARLLYEENCGVVTAWLMKNYRIRKDMALEVYQEAFTIFFYQVRNGSLTGIRCELSTYLTGIVKNLMKQRNQKYAFMALEDMHADPAVDNLAEDAVSSAYEKLLVQQLLDTVGDPCRTILQLFYRKRYSLESIASNLDYKNANVVKKKKSLCLKQLRELFRASKRVSP